MQRLLLAVVVIVFNLQASWCLAGTLSFDLREQMRLDQPVSGDFDQMRTIEGVDGALESHGKFVLISGEALLFHVLEPRESLEVFSDGTGGRSTGVRSRAQRKMIQSMMDLSILEDERFDVMLSGAPDSWTLELTPSADSRQGRSLLKYLDSVHMEGGRFLRSIRIASPDGARTTISFSSLVLRETLTKNECDSLQMHLSFKVKECS